jgi:hypothetical protein
VAARYRNHVRAAGWERYSSANRRRYRNGLLAIEELIDVTCEFHFEIAENAKPIQRLAPPSEAERFEGIGFSSSGHLLAVATAAGNGVLLYRRKTDGQFEDTPYLRIGEPNCRLRYPHDVSFAACRDTELLIVAQRGEALTIYRIRQENADYRVEMVQEISGPETKLSNSDGAALVPPDSEYLAACNLASASINFYRQCSRSPICFGSTPTFELKHSSVYNPDGLAFSRCGSWLAIANHGNHSVSIFQRLRKTLTGGELRYGPEPVTIIQDPRLRYPHSVAFTPWTNHLIVTNAGANYVCVYEPKNRDSGLRWSQTAMLQKRVGRKGTFRKVNSENETEGGAKGVAIHKNSLAVCSPEFGVEIYTFREIVSDHRTF